MVKKMLRRKLKCLSSLQLMVTIDAINGTKFWHSSILTQQYMPYYELHIHLYLMLINFPFFGCHWHFDFFCHIFSNSQHIKTKRARTLILNWLIYIRLGPSGIQNFEERNLVTLNIYCITIPLLYVIQTNLPELQPYLPGLDWDELFNNIRT